MIICSYVGLFAYCASNKKGDAACTGGMGSKSHGCSKVQQGCQCTRQVCCFSLFQIKTKETDDKGTLCHGDYLCDMKFQGATITGYSFSEISEVLMLTALSCYQWYWR